MAGNEGWPKARERGDYRGDPTARFQTPDGVLNSARSLAGPLRTGTSPDVGPRARGVDAVGRDYASDFGMDRVRPQEFDPIGTSLSRYRPGGLPSELITEQVRRPRRP